MVQGLCLLDQVDTNASINDKLRKCAVLDIPVLIKAPVSMDVWAIDPKLDKLTKKDVVLSKTNDVERRLYKEHLAEEQQFSLSDKPRNNTLYMSTSTKLHHVEYLKLKVIDINRLVLMGQVDINKFDAVLIYNNETHDLKLQRSVPVPIYKYDIDEVSEIYETFIPTPITNILRKKFSLLDHKLDYVLCKTNVNEVEKYNHPVDYIETFTVNLSECWILKEYVNDVLFDNSAYEKSRYFLSSEYHTSTSFVKFSQAAFDFIDKGIPGGKINYLSKNLGVFTAKNVSEGGSRMINLIKKEPEKNYFEKLKEIFERFWLAQPVKDKTAALKIAQDVVGDLEIELELKSSNAKGVEMILRPDKFK